MPYNTFRYLRMCIKSSNFAALFENFKSMNYSASSDRYSRQETMYARCGKSGIMLPKVSLGFWHNFGDVLSLIMHSITESPILILRITTESLPVAQRPISAG